MGIDPDIESKYIPLDNQVHMVVQPEIKTIINLTD
jgi:hypothetical protein